MYSRLRQIRWGSCATYYSFDNAFRVVKLSIEDQAVHIDAVGIITVA